MPNMSREWVEELKAQMWNHDNIKILVLDENGNTTEGNVNSVSYDNLEDTIVIEVQ